MTPYLIEADQYWDMEQRDWFEANVPTAVLTETAACFTSEEDYLLFKMKYAGFITWETPESIKKRIDEMTDGLARKFPDIAGYKALPAHDLQTLIIPAGKAAKWSQQMSMLSNRSSVGDEDQSWAIRTSDDPR